MTAPERRWRQRRMAAVTAAAATLVAALAAVIVADPAATVARPVDNEAARQIVPMAYFVETFEDDAWADRWIRSSSSKVVNDQLVLDFNGEWAVAPPSIKPVNESTRGLIVMSAARQHGISARLPQPVDFAVDNKPFIIQYEVRTQQTVSCGGAYLKLLTATEGFTPETFNDKTPYTIMFGPDKCGPTGKIHFILRHENPVSHEVKEHHFKNVPLPMDSTNTRLYTLIIRPDETFSIYVDQEEVKSGNLLANLDPPIIPPKTIPDPDDKKPDDWVDEAKIADPTATKPEDWDEDAPLMIEDETAVQPVDWLDDEPARIPDPNAQKPAEWSDEDDGEWEAPLIPNPKCAQASGCGEWKRPLKRNPAYKGKWKPPMIDNPAYKGPWAPREIPNPEYYEHATSLKMSPIAAVGFDLWTMQNNILFDNILLTSSEEEAKAFAERTWRPKHEAELALEAKLNTPTPKTWRAQVDEYARLLQTELKNYWTRAKNDVTAFVTKLSKDPVAAARKHPYSAAGSALAAAALLALLSWAVSAAGKSTRHRSPEAKQAGKPQDAPGASASASDVDVDAAATGPTAPAATS